jgi:hypothetical protein
MKERSKIKMERRLIRRLSANALNIFRTDRSWGGKCHLCSPAFAGRTEARPVGPSHTFTMFSTSGDVPRGQNKVNVWDGPEFLAFPTAKAPQLWFITLPFGLRYQIGVRIHEIVGQRFLVSEQDGGRMER